ncbi:MAG: flavodoxin family protein [Anaerolineales bacterium]
MKGFVMYDSAFGNTEQIAMAIGSTLGSPDEIEVLRVGEVKMEGLTGLELLIVGSPTQRFKPTEATSDFLKRIPANYLQGTKVAAFDTRLTIEEIEETRILAFFVRFFGYAAKPIANKLKKKGGKLVASPKGFYVQGMKGPLVEGEIERAAAWARQIIATK